MIQHIYKHDSSDYGLLYAWFPAMHTRVDVVLYSTLPESALLSTVRDIQQLVAALEAMGNCYDEGSELAGVNRMAAHQPVTLSDELYLLLSRCVEYNKATLGLFDVTVHSIGYDSHAMSAVILDSLRQTVSYARTGIRICLSAILKGYALDKLRTLLLARGIRDALISMGNSSVLGLGNHPHGIGWKLSDEVILSNQCYTVSGNDVPDRRHILSPTTGTLIEGKRQVGIVTHEGSLGEVLSTALFAASEEQRALLIEQFRSKLLYVSCS